MASLAVSKSVSSVTETSSEGSSRCEMGENRWSSSADVSAYELSPVASGSASKVPMQPRRECSWVRGDTVFQVTKRGYSVSSLLRLELMEFVLDAGVVTVVLGSREEEEEEEGVEEPLGELSERRCTAGLRSGPPGVDEEASVS